MGETYARIQAQRNMWGDWGFVPNYTSGISDMAKDYRERRFSEPVKCLQNGYFGQARQQTEIFLNYPTFVDFFFIFSWTKID